MFCIRVHELCKVVAILESLQKFYKFRCQFFLFVFFGISFLSFFERDRSSHWEPGDVLICVLIKNIAFYSTHVGSILGFEVSQVVQIHPKVVFFMPVVFKGYTLLQELCLADIAYEAVELSVKIY